MTRSACRFVGPESFRALTHNPVALELFPKSRPGTRLTGRTGRTRPTARPAVEHVDLAASADLVVVAPATANVIGKLAAGIADDLLSTTLLAVPRQTVSQGRVLFAPAMNTNMWQNPSVQANISRLKTGGYRFIAPEEGELACGTLGPGRMAEPSAIFSACRSALLNLQSAVCNLQSVRVLVTAGRTEEPLDPVRVITNRSSGRMGVELAQACVEAGASVHLIAGELSVPPPAQVTVTRATQAKAMLAAVLGALPRTDVLLMCAAVADFRPARVSKAKAHDRTLMLQLERTPDILTEIGRRSHHALVVGFSLDNSLARARKKLREKRLDLVVANPYSTVGSGSIVARLLYPNGRARRLKPMPKTEFARLLASEVAGLYHGRRRT
jgi:phosphopantothenoylcysteine decarboxylase/phosphopantothenate--cysteine ligase